MERGRGRGGRKEDREATERVQSIMEREGEGIEKEGKGRGKRGRR